MRSVFREIYEDLRDVTLNLGTQLEIDSPNNPNTIEYRNKLMKNIKRTSKPDWNRVDTTKWRKDIKITDYNNPPIKPNQFDELRLDTEVYSDKQQVLRSFIAQNGLIDQVVPGTNKPLSTDDDYFKALQSIGKFLADNRLAMERLQLPYEKITTDPVDRTVFEAFQKSININRENYEANQEMSAIMDVKAPGQNKPAESQVVSPDSSRQPTPNASSRSSTASTHSLSSSNSTLFGNPHRPTTVIRQATDSKANSPKRPGSH